MIMMITLFIMVMMLLFNCSDYNSDHDNAVDIDSNDVINSM